MKEKEKSKIVIGRRLIISLALPLLAGFIGSIFTTPNLSSWYDNLSKPPLTPPGSFIGIVWTILYILIGISLFLAWNTEQPKKKSKEYTKYRKLGFVFFGIQIILNSFWSIFFFGLNNAWLGIVIILPLIVMIALNIYFFYKIKKVSAYFLIPYLVWVCFATFLNFGIAILN